MIPGLKTILFSFAVFFATTVYAQTNTTVVETGHGTTVVTHIHNTQEEDGRIVGAIYTKFKKESALVGTDLTVVSNAGTVTITGHVTAQSQADQAVQVAKLIPGVRGVISKIVVTTNPGGSVQPQTKNY